MNRTRFILIICILAIVGFNEFSFATQGPVAWWKLDGDPNDSAGSYHGTIQGNPQFVSGICNQALDFDGIDDYILGSSSPFDFENTTFSTAAWFELTSGGDAILAEGAYYGGWLFQVNYGGKVSILMKNSSGGDAYWSNTVDSYNDGKWHHAAAIVTTSTSDKNLNSAVIYVDGYIVSVTEGKQWPYSSSSAPWMIANRSVGALHFDGVIDDVRIYDRALSAEEIEEIYRYGIEEPNLIGLEIEGPNEVPEDSINQYEAVAIYDNDSTKDVTGQAVWAVEPNISADIAAGQLTTYELTMPQENVTIIAEYDEGNDVFIAEKDVTIQAMCPQGSALQFDGLDDYVKIDDDDIFDFAGGTDYSIAFWFKPAVTVSSGTNQNLIGHNDGTKGFYVGFHGGDNGEISLGTHNGRVKTTKNIWHGGVWYYIVVVNKGSDDDRMYLNGVLDGTGENNYTGPPYAGEPLIIGRRSYLFGTNYFSGVIDEVSIYDRALNAEEIQTLMYQIPDIGYPNLVGYWAFDEGQGQIAYDLSGNGNHGYLGTDPCDVDSSDPTWAAGRGVPCTLEGFVERNLNQSLELKANALEMLAEAIEHEWIAKNALDVYFHNRDFGNSSKKDVVKAKQSIHQAIQNEEAAEEFIDRSVDHLEESMDSLGL